MKQLKASIRLIRPAQWAKNGFVFVPLFFAHQITNGEKLAEAFGAFIAFSLVASFIYCLNDLLDIEADKKHPQKALRPLASGAISKGAAVGVMALLLAAAATGVVVGGAHHNDNTMAYLLGFYLLMNMAYSLKLKHIAIVDVLIIAVGFVLRLAVGGAATGIELSHWIVLMTFLLALFMAFAKRRDDVLIYEATGIKARSNIAYYNSTFLNSVLSMLSAVTIVCYVMYTVSDEVTTRFGNQYLYLTSVFVVAGILRYMQLTQVEQQSGSPTKILYRDHFIQISIMLWLISFSIIIYVL